MAKRGGILKDISLQIHSNPRFFETLTQLH